MTKKESFVAEITKFINDGTITLGEDAQTYFDALQTTADKEAPAFTENGKLILKYMQDNKDNYNNLFKAKDIGEGLSISSRTASGGLRKLVTDGYVEKIGESPVVYTLTQKGIDINPDEE